MKKIYTLIAGLLLAGTASAQLVNGNMEGTMTLYNAGLPGVYTSAGWGIGLYSPQSTAPGEGAQSAIMTTVNNPTLAAAIQSPSDTISGQMSQEVNGLIAAPAALVSTFMFKYAPSGIDTGVVVVEIYDTLLAGVNDDVLLYQGLSLMTGTTSTWTNRTITMTATGDLGTANQVYILAGSSFGGIFSGNRGLPRPGSALQLDDVKIISTNVGVEENALANASVFPNPAADVLNFNLNGVDATSIAIFGLDGKLLLTQDANGATGSINVSSLNTGLYIYQIATATGETVKSTFVKK